MRYINKSKPIRFSLLVGGKECLVVEDVKKNFNLSDLYDSLINQNLAKWLSQIGKTDLLEKIESISKTDMLTQKIGLYNLFAPNKLSSDSPNIGTVKELLVKCCITFDDLKGTQYARNIELKKTAIENVDDEIINRWCESDLELLKYVYSKKSYNVLNERNSRTLIDKKIVTDKNLILKIAVDKNLNDILERNCEYDIRVGDTVFEMICVKGCYGGDFYIGKYPVTQKQWKTVMEYNPSCFTLGGYNLPVENVSVDDCQRFINKLNMMTGEKFRLPEIEEWRYAEKGGNKRSGFKYSGSNSITEVGWNCSNSRGETHTVGQKKPNELGIYDMSGNVRELCKDSKFGGYFSCGGSYDDYAENCLISHSVNPNSRRDNQGLRLALSL
ncbi:MULTISPECIES: formylglycine-generating enzyme family protein [unclassified Bacteroides]|uniref:formylglycine-generating enzyme family protein n=1 Tax=unclassified Bacteroides TaxID=2646097 RepID=UPI000689BDE0|nr:MULTISPECIES: formylglycine-generating enzyme family protein [unclassified Bacteroides]